MICICSFDGWVGKPGREKRRLPQLKCILDKLNDISSTYQIDGYVIGVDFNSGHWEGSWSKNHKFLEDNDWMIIYGIYKKDWINYQLLIIIMVLQIYQLNRMK